MGRKLGLDNTVARVAASPPIDGIENVGGPAKITFEWSSRSRSW
ncbi:hypothetical protein [Mycobacterium sp.]